MKNSVTNTNPCKVVTGIARLSYANIWTAKSINGGTPKYSTSVLIPKSDTATVQKIKAAILAAYEEGESKLKLHRRGALYRRHEAGSSML